MNEEETITRAIIGASLRVFALTFFILSLIAISLKALHFTILGLSSATLFTCLSFILKSTNNQRPLLLISLCCLYPYTWFLPITGSQNANGLLTSEFLETPSTPWFQGIPEGEILNIGEQLGYTKAEKESLQEVGILAQQYHEIEASNLFKENYSILMDSWLTDRKHYWYLDGKKDAPLLIFLHGSGGNFKSYQYWFSQEAKTLGIHMAFPTWGLGTWSPNKLETRLLKLIQHLKQNKNFNHDSIYICGLSKGSMTGLKALALGKIKINGFISLSGVSLLSDKQIFSLSATPIYFIHGSKDERSNSHYCQNIATSLIELNQHTKFEEYSGNHTIIKVHTKPIVRSILNWINN